MSNVSDIKPWFREDLARMLMSVYFASTPSGASRHLPHAAHRGGNDCGSGA